MYRWETVAQSDRVVVGYKKLRYSETRTDRTIGFVFKMRDGQWRASTSVIVGTYPTEAQARAALENATVAKDD
jgi:hypothetical protein